MILERLQSFSDFASKVTKMSSPRINEEDGELKKNDNTEEAPKDDDRDEKIKDLENRIAEIDKKIEAKESELATLEDGEKEEAGDTETTTEEPKGTETTTEEPKVKKKPEVKKKQSKEVDTDTTEETPKTDTDTTEETPKKKEKEEDEEEVPTESVNPRTVGEAINQLYGTDTPTMSPGAQQFVSGQSLRNPNTNVQPEQPDLKAMDELMHPDDKKILAGAGPSGMPNNNIADRMRNLMDKM